MRTRRRLATFVAIAVLAATGAVGTTTAGAADPAGSIANGTVTMGISQTGSLIVDGVGIVYDATGADGIAPGCWCEGWGAGDATTGVSGWSDSNDSDEHMVVEDYTRTADTAVSTVVIPDATDPILRVTHDFHPSASPNLFEATVTIENTSDATVDPRYRRAMDWDIAPTTFDEAVTIQGSEASDNVLFASDDGFATPDPFAGESWINFVGDAVDNTDEVLTPGGDGPDSDHGALFDFGFAPIAPGASVSFDIYYGAAGTETAAQVALAAVDAELYSFGQPNTPEGMADGVPNTFIFAFSGVGGSAAFSPLTLTPETAENPVGTSHTVTATLSFDDGPVADQPISFEVTEGPHAGTTGTATTDADGVATFTYEGTSEGTDTIVASTTYLENVLTSDPVTATWVTGTDPTVPPTTAPTTDVPPVPHSGPAAAAATPVAAQPVYTG